MESQASTSYSEENSWWIRGRCIGRGSFAAVHTAVSKSTGRIFAVKSVEISNSSQKQQLEALENEIRVLRVLNPSPYIVQYLGDDVTSSKRAAGYRNLHLEYLPYGTVSGCQKSEQLVRSYTRCLVAALAHSHARNVVHCDVKGQNVLIGQNPGECKLADFGSATEFSPAIRTTIMPRGSPLWMAPEVIRGEYQGPESDVWSLGCTVIEMLTGKPAWADRGAESTVWEIAFSNEVPEIPVGISEQGRDFLRKCLRRNSAERWSCDQLLGHPFVSEIDTPSFSPRCVLDVFESETEESESKFKEEFDLNSNSNSAIEELCGGGGGSSGPIWEDDDDGDVWMTVRKEYSDSVTGKGETEIVEENKGSNCNFRGLVWNAGVELSYGHG